MIYFRSAHLPAIVVPVADLPEPTSRPVPITQIQFPHSPSVIPQIPTHNHHDSQAADDEGIGIPRYHKLSFPTYDGKTLSDGSPSVSTSSEPRELVRLTKFGWHPSTSLGVLSTGFTCLSVMPATSMPYHGLPSDNCASNVSDHLSEPITCRTLHDSNSAGPLLIIKRHFRLIWHMLVTYPQSNKCSCSLEDCRTPSEPASSFRHHKIYSVPCPWHEHMNAEQQP